MSDVEALAGFVAKWRERWPEWRIAEVFVQNDQREACVAWFALQQELAEAAWGGSDPTPGEAKLGWWAEELQGWSQGRRRHPLALVLQRLPAPWLPLAASLPVLAASREAAPTGRQAVDLLVPVARAIAGVDAALFGKAAEAEAASSVLLATQLLLQADAAAPLQLRARLGHAGGDEAIARAWAVDLLQDWPDMHGARPPRIRQALLRRRLQRFSDGQARLQSLPALATLRTAWSAARG